MMINMFQPKVLLLIFLFIGLLFPAVSGANLVATPGNDTVPKGITQDEKILFNMINDMRRQNKLPSIPFSAELCKVANTHIADLIKTRPQDKGCSLHSWSGSGKWTSCCNTKDVFGIQCMKSKPREITGYKGDGFELIYWSEGNADPAEAAALWKQVDASSDMILSRAKWSGYQWKALGVGIKEGYAILWLGDSISDNSPANADQDTPIVEKPASKVAAVAKPESKPVVTQKEVAKPTPPVKQKVETTVRKTSSQTIAETGIVYYLVAASFSNEKAAQNELQSIKAKGYPGSFILKGDNLFRIVIDTFYTKESADSLKLMLKDKIPGIWVYKK